MRLSSFAPAVLATLALALLAPAQTRPAAKPAAAQHFDKPAFEDYLRYMNVWGPQIKLEIADPVPSKTLAGTSEIKVHASMGERSSDYLFYLAPDGKHFISGNVGDLSQDPFASDREKLKTEFQPSFGTPGAPVVIVEFSDFQCGYCREEAKAIRANLLKTYPKEVRFYFKDFPLEAIHDWSKQAAIAGRCVSRQNPVAFWDFHDWIFESQPQITKANLREKVGAFASGKGLDTLQLNKCMDTNATEAEVNKSIAEGKELGINSTPTLFVNGRKIASALSWDDLKYLIDFELDRSKKTGKKGEESCCTTEIPSPFSKKN